MNDVIWLFVVTAKYLPVVWCFRDCMENRICDEQRMGIERNEYLLIVLGKSYLKVIIKQQISQAIHKLVRVKEIYISM